jgi:hypothetical protein
MLPALAPMTLALALSLSATQAQVTVVIPANTRVDAGLPFRLPVYYFNYGTTAVINQVVDVTLPPSFTLTSAPDYCSISGADVICAIATIPPAGPGQSFELELIAPDILTGLSAPVHATITGGGSESTTILVARTFVVANEDDAGPGSLRAAIDDANAGCTDGFPCEIAFRLGMPDENGVYTIVPKSPLPIITGHALRVDGTTQARGPSGDTNPNGPEVFIDGSSAGRGDGIALGTCDIEVRGLAIGNFAGTGIHLLHSDCGRNAIDGNYLGVQPDGVHAAPNERGIVVDQAIADIYRNLISGNRRSGVFLVARPADPFFHEQSVSSVISSNTIGLDRTLQPLGNGASGIYVAGSAYVIANYIAFNHDFGVDVADTASDADIQFNSIFANWQIGIEVGGGAPGVTVLSARYDAASNRTHIELVPAIAGNINVLIDVYASDAPNALTGFGDGQYYLGSPEVFTPGSTITLDALGDWRGKWVCATETARTAFEVFNTPINRTSELSRAVKVE